MLLPITPTVGTSSVYSFITIYIANRAAKNPFGIDALRLKLEWLEDPRFIDATKNLIQIHSDRQAALNKVMHRYRRYQREAEGRCRKALAVWISHAGQNNKKCETNPITIID